MADALLSEKKSSTKDVEKGNDEFSDTLLMEKKSLTKDVDKGRGELADTLLMEKKSSTKDFDKGTDELKYMKYAVVTIHRKSLDKFDGQYKVSKGYYTHDSRILKTTFFTSH